MREKVVLATWWLLLSIVAVVNAANTPCTLNNLMVSSVGGKMLVDLSKAVCMIANEEIADVFAGSKPEGCSWNNMFYTKVRDCTPFFRRKMIPYGRKIKMSNNRLTAEPMFLLHLCRLGGAFSKEYKDGETCAVEQDDVIESENDQFELEHDGIEVCRVARSRLIDRCSRSLDPITKSTKRTKELCAEKFKQLLQISTHSRSTAGTIPKFTPTQATVLMPEMALPFDVLKISAWKEAAAADGTATTTAQPVVFQQGDSTENFETAVKALFARGRNAILSEDQRLPFVKAVARALFGPTLPAQTNRLNIFAGTFLTTIFDNNEHAVVKFLQSKFFTDPWPNLNYGQLKPKLQKCFQDFSVSLKTLVPFIPAQDWNHVRQGSAILDPLLELWTGRKYILYGVTWINGKLTLLREGLNVWQAFFQPPKKTKRFAAAFVSLTDQVAFMLSNKIPFQELIKPYSEWLLIPGRLVFKITTTSATCPSYPATNLDYYIEENRKEACEHTSIKQMCALCPPLPTDSVGLRRCRRQTRFDHQQYHFNGEFKGRNVQIKETRGRDHDLVVFVDVSPEVWLAVMDLLGVTVQEKQLVEIDVPTNRDEAIAQSLMAFEPTQVYDTRIHCDGDALDINRNADSAKGYDSLNLWSCVPKFKPSSGLTRNRKLVMWIAIMPGKDNFVNNNGYGHAGGFSRMIREIQTSISVDYEGNYWGMPLEAVVDSMCAEGLCGGYGCRGKYDIPGCSDCCRKDDGMSYDAENVGGTPMQKVDAYKQNGCGINRLMVGADILKLAQTDFKRIVGLELFIEHWPPCKEALHGLRGNPLIFEAAVKEACGTIFKIARPPKKYDRENRNFKKNWATPVVRGVVVFWCPKKEPTCKKFFNALSSAFYLVPANTGLVEAAAAPNNGPEGGQVDGGQVDDPVAEANELEEEVDLEEAEGEADGDEDQTHGVHVTNAGPNLNANNFVQLDANKGGYIFGVPSITAINIVETALEEYVVLHRDRIGLGGESKKVSQETVLQYYVQDKNIRVANMEALKVKINDAPVQTKEEKKQKKKLQLKLKALEDQQTTLRGLKELLYLLDRDETSVLCATPTNEASTNLIKQMKDIVEFDIAFNPGTVRKRLFNLVSSHRKPKPPKQGEANPLSVWRNWAKPSSSNVMHQKYSLLWGPLQFDQKKLGLCPYQDSLHTGLRCYGTSFGMFVLQELEVFDDKCTVYGESRSTCMKNEVWDTCGTWVGDELNAGKFPRKKIKKNGGHVFFKCLYNLDMGKCFKPTTSRSKIASREYCKNEATVQEGVRHVQRLFRFMHGFDFQSNDRVEDFEYTEGDRVAMRKDREEAGRTAFDILKQIRPTSTLKTTKKNKDGSTTESERRYNPFATRNCRYAGAFMLALFDQGVDTNIVNAAMSERTNGDLRQMARHHTMRNDLQTKQLLVTRATQQRKHLLLPGATKQYVKLHKSRAAKKAAEWDPKKIIEEARESVHHWEDATFSIPDDFVASSSFLRNQEIDLEGGDDEIGGLLQDNQGRDNGDVDGGDNGDENEDTALDRDMNEEDATAEVAATLFENNAEEGGENDDEEGGENDDDAQWA